MKKISFLLLCCFLISINSFAAAPTRPNTYTSGTVISSVDVTGNEVPLYSYLQAGVDTYRPGSITQAAISSTAGILYSQLNLAGQLMPADINTSNGALIFIFPNLLVNTNFNVGAAITGNILYNNGTTYTPLAIGTQGQTLVSTGTVPQWGSPPYIKVTETQTSGTNGSTASTGVWTTTVLNTKDSDTANIAALSGNQITLPAGTYLVNASIPGYEVGGIQARLQNITASSTLLTGTSTPDGAAINVSITSNITGIVTLSISSAIALQYQVSIAGNIGRANSFGTEVYSVITFTKIA